MITDMDKWTRVRRDVLANDMSRREACKKYNLNFRTIQKIVGHQEPPGYRGKVARGKPTIGPFIPIIHEILEADKKAHPKQRHTGKRIFERLRDEHGYTGKITVVRDEIRRYRQSTAEVFMPLAHPPGEAQFDFGKPFEQWNLPEVFAVLRRRLESEGGSDGRREFIKILRLLETHKLRELAAASFLLQLCEQELIDREKRAADPRKTSSLRRSSISSNRTPSHIAL